MTIMTLDRSLQQCNDNNGEITGHDRYELPVNIPDRDADRVTQTVMQARAAFGRQLFRT